MTTPADEQLLTAFSDAVRTCATAPGRPSAALAQLLATGLLTDQSDPSTRTTGHPARASRKRPRMLLSTLTAKLAAAGVAAKAAAATGVVAVALTGTATTVTLAGTDEAPPPAVETVEAPAGDGTPVVDEEQDPAPVDEEQDPAPVDEEPAPAPVEEPAEEPVDGEETPAPPAEEEPAEVPGTDPRETAAAEWAEGPDEGQSHGDWVSEGARNGWVTGERVSDAAHQRNADRREAREEARRPAEEPAAEEPAAEPEVEEGAPAPAPEPAAEPRGNGNGQGNGNGNGIGRK